MKKIISIAAAMATVLSSTAVSAGAMFENIPSTRIWDEEFEIFDAMDSGSAVTDIDGDGSFTLTDCYTLYGYTHGFETDKSFAAYADSAADYNGSGTVDEKDAEHLIRYYIVNNRLSRSATKPAYYSSVNKLYSSNAGGSGALSGFSYDLSHARAFTDELLRQTDYLMAGYPVFLDMLESGEVNYDIDGDSKVFFDDVNYMWVYNKNKNNCQYMDFTMAEAAYPPGNTYYPCQLIYEQLHDDLGMTWIWEYALMYCFENYEVKPEYFTNEYYENIFPGSGKYKFGQYAQQCYEEWLNKNEYLSFNGALFNRQYLRFVKEKEDDASYLPDTNGDGVLDICDTFNICIYLEDLHSGADAETTVLPEDVWTFFAEDCDINENGLSGDAHDLSILDLFIIDRMEDEELMDMYDNYSEKLKTYIGRLSNERGIPAVKYSPEKYSSPVALSNDIERTGDSNADGSRDMADVVFIMQAMANPNKYKLSAIGRFNADIHDTGDGITLMDAQAMQNRLLGIE